jgi:RNA polymerase sigma-70 factor, ECF subfamily
MPRDRIHLERLRSVEPDAVNQLFDEHHRTLYRFFYCRQCDHHQAEEHTAETFLQIVKSLPTFRGGTSQLRAFVFSIARRVLYRHYRTPAITSFDDSSEDRSDGREEPFDVIARGEEFDLLMAQVNQLKPTVRDILLLRYVDDLPLSEIAEILDLPVGTIKSHLHRGRREIQEVSATKETT